MIAVVLWACCLGQPMPAAAPTFTAVTVAGGKTGPLEAVGKNWLVTLGGTAIDQVISLRNPAVPLPAFPNHGMLFANGDRLAGTVTGGDDRSVRLKTAWAPSDVRVPLPLVRVVWFDVMPEGTSPFPQDYRWLGDTAKVDRLLLKNGDVTSGTLETLTPDGVKFRPTTGTTVAYPSAGLSALATNPALILTPKIKGPTARFILKDGSRVTASAATVTEQTVRITTVFGATLTVPTADLVAVNVLGGWGTPLDQLTPAEATSEPFGELVWPLRRGRSAKNGPLLVTEPAGVSTFDSGLGVHGTSAVRYPLAGKYQRFEALVGLDAETGRRGVVTVALRVDDRLIPINDGKPLRSADSAVRVSVDVSGAKMLTLIVELGTAGDVQADVNWADARLIAKP